MSALSRAAVALFQRGDLDGANGVCDEILAAEPDNAAAWHLRGVLALRGRKFDRAAYALERAVALSADDYEMLVNLGMALIAAGRTEEAPVPLERAVSLGANRGEAHLYLGRCRLARKDFEAAEREFCTALDARPGWTEAIEGIADIALRTGRHHEALSLAQQCLSEDPDRSESHRIAADVLTRRHEYDLACLHYEAALQSDQNNARAHSNQGLLLYRIGRFDEAALAYRRGLALSPDDDATKFGLACVELLRGDLREGWMLYENRPQAPAHKAMLEGLAPPRLRRLPERGKHVLLWSDQGIGEQLMFASLIPELARIGATLMISSDPRLRPLLQRSFPRVSFVETEDAARASSSCDAHAGLADAAAWLRPAFETFPRHNGYLTPDSDRARELTRFYRKLANGRPIVGISWRTVADSKFRDPKSLPLGQWGPILCVPGIFFVNLQYGDCAAEVEAVSARFGVKLHPPAVDPLSDLDGFAALVSAMDLVITTSNTTAHMAGALGKPVWVLLSLGLGGFWHWFLDKTDSPWYPSARLFRQAKQGDWGHVIDAVSVALVEFVGAQNAIQRF